MVGFGGWLLIILILVIIIVIIVYIIQKIGGKQSTNITSGTIESNALIQDFVDQVETIQYWIPTGKPQVGPDQDRNVCALYTFPGRTVEIQGQTVFEPGIPSLDPNNLINVTPNPNFIQQCYDPDQIVAQQFIRTCNNPNPGEGCLGTDGNIYKTGESQIYYSLCSQPKRCTDNLAAIAIQFDPLDSDHIDQIKCFEVQEVGDKTNGKDCDISNYLQLFRVGRFNPGLVSNDNGPYAQIIHRDTGLCLVPDPNVNTPQNKTNIVLDTCTPNNGALWWTFPSVVLKGEACDTSDTEKTCRPPQQLVYTPSTNVEIPKSNEELNKFVAQNYNNMFSIQRNSDNDDLELRHFNLGKIGDSDSWKANTQIINYNLYNTLYNAPVKNGEGRVGYPFYFLGF